MRNKKVLFINSIVGTGSTGRLVSGLCGMLSKKSIDSIVCYGRGKADDGIQTFRIGRDMDVYIHGALSRITDRHGLYSDAATKTLLKVIDSFEPDLIHLHNLHGYYLNYRTLMEDLKKRSVPVIWTLHDCWTFTGHCTHFEYAGCSKWKEEGCHDCTELKEYPKSVFKDASKENFLLKKELFTGFKDLQIVTPSKWLEERVKESFLSGYETTVIPTGIDLGIFKPADSDIKKRKGLENKKVILGVANPWRDRKGLDEFIKLAGILPEEYRIVMIGLKKSQLSLIPDNVTAVEKTESIQEMAEWYNSAEVFLNLTREDTFPTTNIEALACGCPVITYAAGGSPESLDESCGRVVQTDDLKKVEELIKDSSWRDQDIRENCRKRALNYDRDKRYLQYYEECYKKYLTEK
ncbi:MAG: glycosyltransferase [Lachnospiraceae bacterium]|nr:glycosyltransferase [Lachnospiraceae bacterium]